MGKNSKWIDAQRDDPVEEVAVLALETRLERVWHFLELAVDEPKSDLENVHQLRVFARRTSAAWKIFDNCLPSRRARWIRKQCKRVRRAAGDARDVDVMYQNWSERTRQKPSDEATLVLEEIKYRRRLAQRPIDDVHTRLEDKRFVHRTKALLKRIRFRGDDTSPRRFGELAETSLAELTAPYLAVAQADLGSTEALHAFRIQGKRVRYAMEIFAGAFDDDFREALYPLVATLQDRLGTVNDQVTAMRAFAAWRDAADSKSVAEALDNARAEQEQAIESARDELLAWWTPARRSELVAGFGRHLARLKVQVPPERAG